MYMQFKMHTFYYWSFIKKRCLMSWVGMYALDSKEETEKNNKQLELVIRQSSKCKFISSLNLIIIRSDDWSCCQLSIFYMTNSFKFINFYQ